MSYMMTQAPLPYDKTALEPHISAQTFDFHYGKHHKAYIDKGNELLTATPLHASSLEDAVIESRKMGIGPLFNNIGQHYNHSFFWSSMKPQGGAEPKGALFEAINRDFGSFDKFKEAFVNCGIGQFGSGWVWLIADRKGGKLEITKTANAETPLTDGKVPLIVCDVWEHAYYLDYQNRRADFLKVFVEKLVNWDFATQNYQ